MDACSSRKAYSRDSVAAKGDPRPTPELSYICIQGHLRWRNPGYPLPSMPRLFVRIRSVLGQPGSCDAFAGFTVTMVVTAHTCHHPDES